MPVMSFECTHLRSNLAPEHIPMIRLNVLLYIWVRILGEGTQGSFIIIMHHTRVSQGGLVGIGTCVNMFMEFLSVGFIQHSIGIDFARMAQVAYIESISLPTPLMNSVPSYAPSSLSPMPSQEKTSPFTKAS